MPGASKRSRMPVQDSFATSLFTTFEDLRQKMMTRTVTAPQGRLTVASQCLVFSDPWTSILP